MNTFCDQHYIFETAKTGVEKWLNLSQGAVRHIPAKREMLDMRQRAKLFGKKLSPAVQDANDQFAQGEGELVKELLT